MAKVKRMCGGSGGKKSKAKQLACILAVGARVVGRLVRCMLNHDQNMYVFLFYTWFCGGADYGYRMTSMRVDWKDGDSKDGMLKSSTQMSTIIQKTPSTLAVPL